MKSIFVSAIVCALGWSASSSSFASESVFGRKIQSVGCHNTNGTCYVSLDGAPFGSTLGCPVSSTNEFRFDNAETADGKRAYASFFAAFLSSKTVTVTLTGCSGQGVPMLHYYNVHI